MKNNVLVIAPFLSTEYSNRPLFAAKVLSSIAKVDVITSDFDHHKKNKRKNLLIEGIRKIHCVPTLAYSKNVSLKRFFSHIVFSFRAAFFFLKFRNAYNAIYVTVPLNLAGFLVFVLAGNRKKIMDVVDIWPDSLPFSEEIKKKFRLFFFIWKWPFQKAVKKADFILTVSDVFLYESLRYFQKEKECAKRLYIGNDIIPCQPFRKKEFITIAYIGNLGNLSDLETLVEVLGKEEFLAKFQLYIIGDGDIRERLIKKLKKRNIPYIYFGIVYDTKELGTILGKVDLGFNGYKNTNASFSYKANTYLAANIPIINSMAGDLERIVKKRKIGLNYISEDVDSLCKVLRDINLELLTGLKKNCKKYFFEELVSSKIEKEMRSFFAEAMEINRDRGRPHDLRPLTPPGIRVRTGRFT